MINPLLNNNWIRRKHLIVICTFYKFIIKLVLKNIQYKKYCYILSNILTFNLAKKNKNYFQLKELKKFKKKSLIKILLYF